MCARGEWGRLGKCKRECARSMVYAVNKTESFENDYDGALKYLVEVLKSPQAALSLLGEVDNAIGLLSENPFVHAVSSKPTLHARNAREHFVRNCVIVYRIEGDQALFVRMFHQTQLYELHDMRFDSP